MSNSPLSNGEGESLMPFARRENKQLKTEDASKRQAHASITLSRLGAEDAKERKEELEKEENLGLPGPRNSQSGFATPEQTIIIFDWDDTLFPTTWVRHEKGLHWRFPLDKQTNFSQEERTTIRKQLLSLENYVQRVLKLALTLGHVVVVTLARHPWVHLSCDNFFPEIGEFLRQHNINVVYAQDLRNDDGKQKDYNKQKFASDMEAEKYWTEKKQTAIMQEISKFYKQSQSSWKNTISLGDSDFERFATLHSMEDYAVLADEDDEPEVGSAANKLAMLKPSLSKSKDQKPDDFCRSGWVGQHYRRIRCKTVKMFDSPSIEDLATEMSMLCKWLPYLVKRDAGFDVDLEDDSRLYQAHKELTGEDLL